MTEIVGALDRQVVVIAESHGGRLVKPRGEEDRYFLLFQSAGSAVRSALALQRYVLERDWPVGLRAAIHSGPADERGGDFYGITVIVCARVRSVTRAGQVLLTAAASAEARGDLPDGAELRPLGDHRLKGLARPETLYELTHPSLPTPNPRTHGLPIPPSSFVGRDRELAILTRTLAENRFVALTGPAGIGKSRLALAVAAQRFTEGAEVAHVACDDRAPRPLSTLWRRRRSDRLAVVDDVDADIPAAITRVSEALAKDDQLRVIVTARRGLGAVDTRLELGPLPLDAAVTVLEDRARAVRPDLVLDQGGREAASELCERMGRRPLPIELAARRLAVLTPEQLLDRTIARPERILTTRLRVRPVHHRSWDAALSWPAESH